MRTWNTLAAFVGAILVVLALLFMGGCTSIQTGHPISANVFGAFFGMALGVGVICLLFGGWRDGWRSASAMFCAAVMLFIAGCAALPMPLQPKNTLGFDSSTAEGAFIVLAAADTAQTMHLKSGTNCGYEADPFAAALYGTTHPSPGRVLGINILMITAHTMVASWLDDRVAAESAKNDANEPNSLGPWYVGRVAFHAVSLMAEGAAVANNVRHGCKL